MKDINEFLKFFWPIGAMITGALLLLLIIIASCGCSTTDVKKMEAAYMEGQQDAIEGDVRIQVVNGIGVFVKSPWDHTDTVYTEKLDFRNKSESCGCKVKR